MRSRKLVLENILSLGVLQVANYALPLITLPYLVRVLGAERFGLISFAQAFIQYFVVLTDYGFNLSATRQVAIHRDDEREVSLIFSSVMIVKLSLLLLTYLVMSGVVLAAPRFRADWVVYQVSFLAVLGSVLFPVWFFQGMERMKYITGLNLVAKTVTTFGVFMLVRTSADYVEAAFLQSVGFVIVGVLGLVSVRRVLPVRLLRPSMGRLRAVVIDGWHVFLAQIASTAFAPTSVFVLGLLSTTQAVGYYSIAQKAAKAVIYLCIPVHTAIYPRVSHLFVESRRAALAFLRRATVLGGAAFLLLSGALCAGADLAARFMVGHPCAEVALLIRVMSPLPFTIYLDNIVGTQIMLNTGMEREFGRAVMYAAAFSVVASVLLAPRTGAVGSAVAFLSSEILALVLMTVMVWRSGTLRRGDLRLENSCDDPSQGSHCMVEVD